MNYLNKKFDLESDRLLEVIDETPLWSAPFGLNLLDKVNYRKNITALDIGFGAGFPLTELAMRLGTTSKVYGVDIWKAAINRTRKKIAAYGINNVELIEGPAESIPLPDQSIDLIVSNNGINNVENQAQVLKECSRLLKQDGQFVMTMNLDQSLKEFYDVLEEVLKEKGMAKEVERIVDHIYEKRKPLEEFSEQLNASGFNIASLDHHSFYYKFVDGTTMFNHYFIQLAFLEGWKSIVPEKRQQEVFQLVEQNINTIAGKHGCFQLTIPFIVIECLVNH